MVVREGSLEIHKSDEETLNIQMKQYLKILTDIAGNYSPNILEKNL